MSESRHIPVRTAPSGRRRRRWVILLTAAVVLSPWLGRFTYLRITLRPTPRPAHWRAQLAALDPPGPGAMPLEQVRKLLDNCPRIATPVVAPPLAPRSGSASPRGAPTGAGLVAATPDPHGLGMLLDGRWDESRPELMAGDQLFLSATFKTTREAMRKALEAGWWDEAIMVAPDFTNEHAAYLEWARCFVAHSRWAREHEADAKVMTEDWLMTFRLARQLRRGQTLMSTMLSCSVARQAGMEIDLAAREGSPQVDTALLVREVDSILPPVLLSVGLAKATWIEAHNSIDTYFVRNGGDWLDVSELATGWNAARSAWRGSPQSRTSHTRLLNIASPLFHDYATACLNVDRQSEALGSLTDLRACRRMAAASTDVLAGTASILDGQTRVFDRNDIERIAMFYSGMMEVDAGLTMLALAEFNRREGHYPEQLAELVPACLPRLPRDCSDWDVLRYRREGTSFVLYSLGPNGKDHGGRRAESRTGGILEDPGDVVFGVSSRVKE